MAVVYNDELALLKLQPDNQGTFINVIKSVNIDVNLKKAELPTTFVNNLNQPVVPPGELPLPGSYYPILEREENALQVQMSEERNYLIDNYYRDNYSQVPYSSKGSAASIALLDTISGPTASISTVKKPSRKFHFDNGDESFLVSTMQKRALVIFQNNYWRRMIISMHPLQKNSL
ncbi:MAG: hypothetical protein WDO16_02095, partial [Bacteroidota bacterium]